ncbi:MAG: GNAT family N-acetyltransferase [Gammaproteobacteria bacterium]
MQNFPTIDIIQYSAEKKSTWDQFVARGRNTHFMFERDYMEYHSDRFQDHSLLFYEQSNLLAVLPASKHNDLLNSHGGLTFGGLITDKKIKTSQVLEIFTALKAYLVENKFKTLRYKAIPYIYHEIPAEEDLYALFINEASLVRRDISSTIFSQNKLNFSGCKKNVIAKAKKSRITINESDDFIKFHQMINAILSKKYDTQATHTAEEMLLLANKFPQNIKLYGAYRDSEMIAGALLYITTNVAHTQYLATTETGRELGALDFLLHFLINEAYTMKQFFDFGISTENQGRYLNSGLISQKEMFGARAVVFDTYELKLTN